MQRLPIPGGAAVVARLTAGQFAALQSAALQCAVGLLAAGLFAADLTAQQDEPSDHMMVVAASTLMGAGLAVGGDDDATTSCRDFLVDIRSGELVAAVLDGGLVVPASVMRWNLDASRFEVPGLPLAGGPASAFEQPSAAAAGDGDRIARILLGDLVGLPLRGARDADGDRVELGDLGGAFVDVVHRRVRFVTTSVGGVLGIGADAKVLPWGVVDIVWSDTDELVAFVPSTAERLEAAPTAEKGAESVADPTYRDRVYSFFGVDRPESDRRAAHADEIAPLRRWIGAQIATASEGRVTVEDVLIGRDKDAAVFLRLDSGVVTPAADAEWTSTPDGTRALKIGDGDERVAASDLVSGSSLLGAEVRAGVGSVGSVQNLYCRTDTGAITFVTIEVGGVLGIGATVKALPWRLFEVTTFEGESVLRTDVAADRLREAPSVTDEPAGSIYSPGFRERVDGFAAGGGGR